MPRCSLCGTERPQADSPCAACDGNRVKACSVRAEREALLRQELDEARARELAADEAASEYASGLEEANREGGEADKLIAALRAEVERRGELLRRMINRCRRCKGTGQIRLGSLALQGPYDRREPRACPDCSEARAALIEREGGEVYWVCPECGPRIAADEDGCCASCGADCTIEREGGKDG
jgi:hypothetical protein